ncbi:MULTISPECIES: PEP-CTERM sorting domain-containing protein [unclassified Oleiphilus]|uniref:PEP-CTERM sorting domain-containing protein n=1 Tax=unclassified Oleiphilus TaxID=2631174 RepID=UPI0007C226EF|nr:MULTISPECIES: PEP-CTERM sorting domain-containing protein [unclassified Oleiphilus]KZY44114.1 hypothetical protein A3732_01735 [Oleiphilus sp. HI0050]KZY73282.1 hypothetical protein A3740_03525 [Oleiphilus sp. HI0068]KZY76989.1 hypothetical protein A3741_10225 [Oleiphilus sp. HI0069]KZY89669.1 hypothetical protein A3743_07880 [Oleiphilus sp. HI0072]KZZ21788.1 hypothetical protein A3752_08095 [Oleiphilus sp. HI0081]
MKLKQLLAAATLAVTSVCALATPQYTGETSATNINLGSQGNGYYLWTTEGNDYQWNVRWRSPNVSSNATWFGSFEVVNGSSPTATTISFDGSDYTSTSNWGNTINWTAKTNSNGYDGFTFDLDKDTKLTRFNLGSSLFADLEDNTTDPGTEDFGIFIGQNYATPNVLVGSKPYTKYKNVDGVIVESRGDGIHQSFEVSVAEPGTLALLGLGLAGLGFARRKQA